MRVSGKSVPGKCLPGRNVGAQIHRDSSRRSRSGRDSIPIKKTHPDSSGRTWDLFHTVEGNDRQSISLQGDYTVHTHVVNVFFKGQITR